MQKTTTWFELLRFLGVQKTKMNWKIWVTLKREMNWFGEKQTRFQQTDVDPDRRTFGRRVENFKS